jgi:hypothetical protein
VTSVCRTATRSRDQQTNPGSRLWTLARGVQRSLELREQGRSHSPLLRCL